MPFEAASGAPAVRYVSVRTGLSPRTGAEKPTDVAGGSGYADRPPGFLPLTRNLMRWLAASDWPSMQRA
jgi:hypothetical protein